MKASTRYEATHAFVVDDKDIKKIWELTAEHCPIQEAKIYCSDDISRICTNSAEITSYENPKRSKILAIELIGTSENNDTSIEIILNERRSRTLSLSIRGEENIISKLRTEIMDYFEGLKPWYSRLATFDHFFFWMPFFVIIAFIISAKVPKETTNNIEITTKQSIIIGFTAFALLACVIAIAIVAIMGSKKLARFVFPVGTFSIGQGLKRHAFAEQVRWSVIVAMVVSFIISLIFFLLS